MFKTNILDAATCGVIQNVIAKSDDELSAPEVVAYLEPFMVRGSITPVSKTDYDENGKRKITPLIPRLTGNAHLLPTATVDKIVQFISICREVSSCCITLLLEVERRLKNALAKELAQSTMSDIWLENPDFFEERGQQNYKKDIEPILIKAAKNTGNAIGSTSAEIIRSTGMSFTNVSKIYYLISNSQKKAKRNISSRFGIMKPDSFSYGLRAISENLRNLDAHVLFSYRKSNDQSRSFPYEMIYPWIATKCNFSEYYGRICFLVYITTSFRQEYLQNARKRIKALLLQMPKMTVNDLGLHSNWSNEPLWSNI